MKFLFIENKLKIDIQRVILHTLHAVDVVFNSILILVEVCDDPFFV